jgi:hypothetical protein
MYDGNHVIASVHARPWRKQLNMLVGYLYFYNVAWLLTNLWRRKTPVKMRPAYMQMVGILGLIPTAWRTTAWALRLMFGKIERLTRPPVCTIPMRAADAATAPAGHATCEMPSPVTGVRRQRAVSLPVAG